MFLATLLALSACDNASDLARTAQTAQKDADTRIAAASADAEQKARAAQAKADVTIADANADFLTLREAYRHDTITALVELDKKIADLEAKALVANGPEKADRQAKLRAIASRREAFMAEYDKLEAASGTTWDATKLRLDAEWATLEASVNQA